MFTFDANITASLHIRLGYITSIINTFIYIYNKSFPFAQN